jgi:hypothetical protein
VGGREGYDRQRLLVHLPLQHWEASVQLEVFDLQTFTQ